MPRPPNPPNRQAAARLSRRRLLQLSAATVLATGLAPHASWPWRVPAEAFLGRYLGGRVEPLGEIPGTSGMLR